MKGVNFILSLVLLVLLGACSRDNIVENESNSTPGITEEKDGYYNIRLGISLGDDPKSRAAISADKSILINDMVLFAVDNTTEIVKDTAIMVKTANGLYSCRIPSTLDLSSMKYYIIANTNENLGNLATVEGSSFQTVLNSKVKLPSVTDSNTPFAYPLMNRQAVTYNSLNSSIVLSHLPARIYLDCSSLAYAIDKITITNTVKQTTLGSLVNRTGNSNKDDILTIEDGTTGVGGSGQNYYYLVYPSSSEDVNVTIEVNKSTRTAIVGKIESGKSYNIKINYVARVACIGNSITAGAGLKDPANDAYPAVLGRLLGGGYWVKNFGVSACTMLNKGDHPYMQEQTFQDALSFNPNIVVVKLGTNDSKPYNWIYKDDYMKDMQTMIDKFAALPAKPSIYLCYPSKVYTDTGLSDKVIVDEIIPKIKETAEKNKLAIIDLHTVTDGKQSMFPGGIHPNEEGAIVIAEAVAKALK